MLKKNSLYNAYKVAFKVTPMGTLLLLISMVTLGTIPGLQAWFFTDLINSLIDKQSGTNIVYLYIILSCITLLQIILYISNDISINTVKNKLEQASTTEIIRIAFSIPQIIIEQEDFQKKLSRAKANIDSYFLLIQGFQNLCATVVAIISFVIYVSTINQYLCIVFVICIFAYSLQMYFQSKKEHKLQLDQASEQRELDYLSKVLTNLEYAKEVRLFNFPKYIIDRWTKNFNKINDEYLVMKKNHLLSNIFVTNTGFLFIGFFFIAAAYSVLSGEGTSGIFAGLVSFLSQLGPMLSNVGNNIKSLNINRMNVHELISYIYLEKTFEKESSNPINMSGGYIRIENVDFRYPNSLQNTLNDINLIIEPGEIVAIVGENGAGKTTLSRLIAGLYQPTNGQISINGVYYNDINNEEISCMAGIVPQEPHNFELSFIDNLCFGQDIIEDQVIATLNKVKLNDLLERLPNKLQTHLGKLFGNEDLSKGEWQKLALARCFIKERLFYVLDEPTSALDPDAEVEILDLLRTLSSDKTTIFISHRLGSLRNVDRIIVLKEGRVVEMGRHQDLIVQNGEYTRLYNTQAFWYMEGA